MVDIGGFLDVGKHIRHRNRRYQQILIQSVVGGVVQQKPGRDGEERVIIEGVTVYQVVINRRRLSRVDIN